MKPKAEGAAQRTESLRRVGAASFEFGSNLVDEGREHHAVEAFHVVEEALQLLGRVAVESQVRAWPSSLFSCRRDGLEDGGVGPSEWHARGLGGQH